ncbi:MAG: M20/M25/M40 family metallo-hydrolase [Stellaceae bacterium]
MPACGHDMHVAWLVGAMTLLARARETWYGTLMAVLQPAEETGEGAQAMIDDGLFDRFPKPDIVLGQHVMVGPAGTISGRAGSLPPRAAACRTDCSGAARMDRCRKPASIPW